MSHPGDLTEAMVRLQRATRQLQERWAETRQHWRDNTAADFERLYLEPLMPSLRIVSAATAEMQELIRQMHRDLE